MSSDECIVGSKISASSAADAELAKIIISNQITITYTDIFVWMKSRPSDTLFNVCCSLELSNVEYSFSNHYIVGEITNCE